MKHPVALARERRRTRLALVAITAGFALGILVCGPEPAPLAAQEAKPRVVRQYWKAGPLGRYQYPALLWRVDEQQQLRRGSPPEIFGRVDAQGIDAAAAVDGQFVDAETKRPIPEVEAIITPSEGEPQVVLTDKRGRFSSEEVPAGEYTVASHAAGYYDQKRTVRLAPGRTNVIRLLLRPRPAAFAGFLRTAAGEAVVGVRMVLRSQDGEIVKEMDTLADGSFAMSGLKPGRYTLEYQVGGKKVKMPLALHPGDIRDLELKVK